MIMFLFFWWERKNGNQHSWRPKFFGKHKIASIITECNPWFLLPIQNKIKKILFTCIRFRNIPFIIDAT